jgi:Paf1
MNFPMDDDLIYAYDLLQGIPSEHEFLHRAGSGVGPDMNVPFTGLSDPLQLFTLPPNLRPPPHPLDAAICSEDAAKPAARAQERAQLEEPMEEWMTRGNFMHLDLHDSVYKHADPEGVRKQRLASQRAVVEAARVRISKLSRTERIEESFAAVAPDAPVSHPTNRALVPRRAWTVLPASKVWSLNHILVEFDADPDNRQSAPSAKRQRLESGLIRTPVQAARAVNVAEQSVLVDYLLPSSKEEETPNAKKQRLEAARRYHMAISKVDNSKSDEQLILLWDDVGGTVSFVPVRARANLTRVPANDEDSNTASISDILRCERETMDAEKDAYDEAFACMIGGSKAAQIREEIIARKAARTSENLLSENVEETTPVTA